MADDFDLRKMLEDQLKHFENTAKAFGFDVARYTNLRDQAHRNADRVKEALKMLEKEN